jgi:H/ACA ribonucleoprotein complex non-core subunit NAF1
MRDEELAALDDLFMSGHAYDEHGPYDIDYASLTGLPSSSRPVPAAYDDPYADSYNLPDVAEPERPPSHSVPRPTPPSNDQNRPSRGRGRGSRGRGHGERGHHGRGRAGRRYQSLALSMPPDQSASYSSLHHEEYSPLYPEQDMLRPPLSQNSFSMYHHASPPQNYLPPFGVQPHINPRFASAFGFSMYPPTGSASQDYAGTQGYVDPHGFSQGQYGSSNLTEEWSIPMQDNSQSEAAQ